MFTQKVYKNGTSIAVTVPKQLARELNIRDGSEVIVDKKNGSMTVSLGKKTRKSKDIQAGSSLEFERWLDMIARDDEQLIKELAKR